MLPNNIENTTLVSHMHKLFTDGYSFQWLQLISEITLLGIFKAKIIFTNSIYADVIYKFHKNEFNSVKTLLSGHEYL